jgi:hypothetical protein
MSLLDLEDKIDTIITKENILALDGWDYSGKRGIYIVKKLYMSQHMHYSHMFGNCTGHIVLDHTNHLCRFVHNSVIVHNQLADGDYKCIRWTEVNTVGDLIAFESLVERELNNWTNIKHKQ